MCIYAECMTSICKFNLILFAHHTIQEQETLQYIVRVSGLKHENNAAFNSFFLSEQECFVSTIILREESGYF